MGVKTYFGENVMATVHRAPFSTRGSCTAGHELKSPKPACVNYNDHSPEQYHQLWNNSTHPSSSVSYKQQHACTLRRPCLSEVRSWKTMRYDDREPEGVTRRRWASHHERRSVTGALQKAPEVINIHLRHSGANLYGGGKRLKGSCYYAMITDGEEHNDRLQL